jgi:GNAT superfamily N-acetyltransferase
VALARVQLRAGADDLASTSGNAAYKCLLSLGHLLPPVSPLTDLTLPDDPRAFASREPAHAELPSQGQTLYGRVAGVGGTSAAGAYDPPVKIRRMRPNELDAAVGVWREANIARGAPHGPERTARIREKLSASDALAFVALRPGVVGMALAEPGRFDDGAGELDPSLLHISMVFVRPDAQRTGVGLPLILHILELAPSMGYERVDVWTAQRTDPPAGSTSVPE